MEDIKKERIERACGIKILGILFDLNRLVTNGEIFEEDNQEKTIELLDEYFRIHRIFDSINKTK